MWPSRTGGVWITKGKEQVTFLLSVADASTRMLCYAGVTPPPSWNGMPRASSIYGRRRKTTGAFAA